MTYARSRCAWEFSLAPQVTVHRVGDRRVLALGILFAALAVKDLKYEYRWGRIIDPTRTS